MQLVLTENDVQTALKRYVSTLISTEGREVTVTLVNSRKGKGPTATVELSDTVDLGNSTVANASKARVATIKETGADVVSYTSGENMSQENAEEVVQKVEETEIPAAGNEPSKSLFD